MKPALLSGGERAAYVQKMFGRIAPHYDLMNRLMTFGMDMGWRREVIRRAALQPGSRLLDLGSGTGDLALEAMQRHPGLTAVAGDFTLEMMRTGQERLQKRAAPAWCGADALNLPFSSSAFNAVISGFLMRNVSDVRLALAEQYRVLKPGGRIVILDTTRPQPNPLTPIINIYLNKVIPTIGRMISGDAEAYAYLPDSTQNFLHAEQMTERLLAAGFHAVGFRRLNFGTIAIHWGQKP